MRNNRVEMSCRLAVAPPRCRSNVCRISFRISVFAPTVNQYTRLATFRHTISPLCPWWGALHRPAFSPTCSRTLANPFSRLKEAIQIMTTAVVIVNNDKGLFGNVCDCAQLFRLQLHQDSSDTSHGFWHGWHHRSAVGRFGPRCPREAVGAEGGKSGVNEKNCGDRSRMGEHDRLTDLLYRVCCCTKWWASLYFIGVIQRG